MTAPHAARDAARLRDAAALIVGCAELKTPLPAAVGAALAALTLPLARPLAALLLVAAVRLESGAIVDEPMHNLLEIARLVLHTDVDRPTDPQRDAP